LLDPQTAAAVRTLGLALRLAYTLCGGRIELLSETWLGRDGTSLVLEVPPADGLFMGETVQRRLDAVARSLGATSVLRRREPRRLAGD
jgi:exopolyphosphatase/guanosine-5'-triphosphate,3'-diphosphate pyrophosphatase